MTVTVRSFCDYSHIPKDLDSSGHHIDMNCSCHLKFAKAEPRSCKCHTFLSRYLVLHIQGGHIRLIVKIKMKEEQKEKE